MSAGGGAGALVHIPEPAGKHDDGRRVASPTPRRACPVPRPGGRSLCSEATIGRLLFIATVLRATPAGTFCVGLTAVELRAAAQHPIAAVRMGSVGPGGHQDRSAGAWAVEQQTSAATDLEPKTDGLRGPLKNQRAQGTEGMTASEPLDAAAWGAVFQAQTGKVEEWNGYCGRREKYALQRRIRRSRRRQGQDTDDDAGSPESTTESGGVPATAFSLETHRAGLAWGAGLEARNSSSSTSASTRSRSSASCSTSAIAPRQDPYAHTRDPYAWRAGVCRGEVRLLSDAQLLAFEGGVTSFPYGGNRMRFDLSSLKGLAWPPPHESLEDHPSAQERPPPPNQRTRTHQQPSADSYGPRPDVSHEDEGRGAGGGVEVMGGGVGEVRGGPVGAQGRESRGFGLVGEVGELELEALENIMGKWEVKSLEERMEEEGEGRRRRTIKDVSREKVARGGSERHVQALASLRRKYVKYSVGGRGAARSGIDAQGGWGGGG
jgi:hypothetical protein